MLLNCSVIEYHLRSNRPVLSPNKKALKFNQDAKEHTDFKI